MNSLKSFLKKLIPESLQKFGRPWYHGLLALVAHYYYKKPSNRLIVIGITGTAGKSTTAAMLTHILNATGHKTGSMSTVEFWDGNSRHINKHGLSMPNEFSLQKNLVTMLANGCKYAVVEATSEGLAQNRQAGVNFNIALFTNLAPAHIQSHGSYKEYRTAKGKLFRKVKMIGANLDDPESKYFLSFPAKKKFGVSLGHTPETDLDSTYVVEATSEVPQLEFSLRSVQFSISLFGRFNIYNAALAIACAHELGISLIDCANAVKTFSEIDGRMEAIPNQRNIKVFVDYAPEPFDMQNALTALQSIPHNKIIHVFGTTGGHRDKSKRFEFGSISAKLSDVIILTNDDVYESDPGEIIADMQYGIEQVVANDRKVKQITVIPDRRTAITEALSIAQPNDIVIITGKGSEQFLVLPGNKRIDWDERQIVKTELSKIA